MLPGPLDLPNSSHIGHFDTGMDMTLGYGSIIRLSLRLYGSDTYIDYTDNLKMLPTSPLIAQRTACLGHLNFIVASNNAKT